MWKFGYLQRKNISLKKIGLTMKEYSYLLGSVPNPKHDDADPDPSFSF
jgi:hypothetical protein